MVRVGVGFYIPHRQISFVGLYNTASVKRKVKILKEKGNFLDLTRNKKTKSVIFYTNDSGVEYGVASMFEVGTILKKMEELNNTRKVKDGGYYEDEEDI